MVSKRRTQTTGKIIEFIERFVINLYKKIKSYLLEKKKASNKNIKS